KHAFLPADFARRKKNYARRKKFFSFFIRRDVERKNGEHGLHGFSRKRHEWTITKTFKTPFIDERAFWVLIVSFLLNSMWRVDERSGKRKKNILSQRDVCQRVTRVSEKITCSNRI
ncbi:MAG: hypothetical protein IK000_08905, partial [Bacteroidaceae bacterium]|nr:hypothetical protein [Bacteroidaceae bacterium]